MSRTIPAPGWYADPAGAAPFRRWDGAIWTRDVATEKPTGLPTGAPNTAPTGLPTGMTGASAAAPQPEVADFDSAAPSRRGRREAEAVVHAEPVGWHIPPNASEPPALAVPLPAPLAAQAPAPVTTPAPAPELAFVPVAAPDLPEPELASSPEVVHFFHSAPEVSTSPLALALGVPAAFGAAGAISAAPVGAAAALGMAAAAPGLPAAPEASFIPSLAMGRRAGSSNTVAGWSLALSPLVMAVPLAVSALSTGAALTSAMFDLTALNTAAFNIAAFGIPGVMLAELVVVASSLAGVMLLLAWLLAFADRRALRFRGHENAVSSAWVLMTPLAYFIARSVRVGAGGLPPLFTFLVMELAAVAAFVVFVVAGTPVV